MLKTRIATAVVGAALALAGTSPAHAAIITLTFDELNGAVHESPLDYYNGGLGSAGTGPGVNYGITFSSNTITGCQTSSACNNTNADQSPSQPNVIYFLGGGASTMNVAAGFDTGFSFYYSAVNNPGIVNVYSGLNSTGTLLASLNLAVTPYSGDPACKSFFCPFVPFGVTFSGTARSVDFAGTNNQITFDNITLGSKTPGTTGAVPEPATWAMMIVGFGLVGGALRRRRVSFAIA